MAFWYLFDFIIKEVSSINIVLRYLLLKIISKGLDKKKALFNYFNKS